MGQGGHSPDCDEAEVCKSQRGPESGTDKDRLIVGSRFWSPPLRNKPLALRILLSCSLPSSSCLTPSHRFTLPYTHQFTHNLGLCLTDLGVLRAWSCCRNVVSCCCCGGVRSPIAAFSRSVVHCGSWRLQTHWAQTMDHAQPLPCPQQAPKLSIPANQLQKVLVLQLLVQGCRSQLLLLLQPLLIHVPLWEVRACLCECAQQEHAQQVRWWGSLRSCCCPHWPSLQPAELTVLTSSGGGEGPGAKGTRPHILITSPRGWKPSSQPLFTKSDMEK